MVLATHEGDFGNLKPYLAQLGNRIPHRPEQRPLLKIHPVQGMVLLLEDQECTRV